MFDRFGRLLQLLQGNRQAQLPGGLGGAQGDQLAIHRRALRPLPGLLVTGRQQGVITRLTAQGRRLLAEGGHGSGHGPAL